MKIQTTISQFIALIAAMCISITTFTLYAEGIPEPGLVMYGVVRNAASGGVRMIGGTIAWTIVPAGGSPITVTSPLSDIGGQYSYLLRVPFQSIVGSAMPSGTALILNSAPTSYFRTNVTFTFGSNTYPATNSAPSFTFNTADRGKTEQVDLMVSAPGIGSALPTFGASTRLPDGRFQMTFTGTAGQNYALLASTNLVNWVPASVFVCTNSPMVIYDPLAGNFNRRFYRIGPASLASMAPPMLAFSSSPSAGNSPALMLSCIPGLDYRVEASTDLVHWTTLTNFLCSNAIIPFRDPAAANYTRRFYRAATP